MTKNRKLSISIAAISLIIVGVNSISHAQTTNSSTSQIVSLQKQINALKSELITSVGMVNSNLGNRVLKLENNSQTSNSTTVTLNYAVVGSGILFCAGNHTIATTVMTFSSPYEQLGMCSIKIIVPSGF